MPKTIIIHTDLPLIQLLDGQTSEGIDSFISEIKSAISKVGTPAFLRTGHLSNKHDWKKSCFITKESDIISHVVNLVEMSCLATMDRVIPIDFWAVREFIKTEPYFSYFPGDMPITKERRFFVRNGTIECHHNYWDRKAFKDDIDEKKFKAMADLSEEDKKELSKMALYVGGMFSGYWSLDFLKGKDGQWYLTDMAIGEQSYHQKHKGASQCTTK
jgi:hypothetical protein